MQLQYNESHGDSTMHVHQHVYAEPPLSEADLRHATPSLARQQIAHHPNQVSRILAACPPEAAAEIIEGLGDAQLLLVGSRVRPELLVPIFSHLWTDTAADLREIMWANFFIEEHARAWKVGPERDWEWGNVLVVCLRRIHASARGSDGYFQYHSAGVMFWSGESGVGMISNDIRDYYIRRDGLRRFGFPIGHDVTETSSYRTLGTYQRFESTEDYPTDVVVARLGPEHLNLPWGATIHRTGEHGTFTTSGTIGACFERSGAAKGPLGYPTTEAAAMDGRLSCVAQLFEGGVVVHQDGDDDAIAVTGKVMELLGDDVQFAHWGLPVSALRPIGGGPDVIQEFERGMVIARPGLPAVFYREE